MKCGLCAWWMSTFFKGPASFTESSWRTRGERIEHLLQDRRMCGLGAAHHPKSEAEASLSSTGSPCGLSCDCPRKASFFTSPSYLRSPFLCFLISPEHGPGAWALTLIPWPEGCTDYLPNQLFCDHLCLEVVPVCGKNTVFRIYLFC